MFFKFYGRVKNDRFVGHSSIKTHKWNALYWKSNWLQKLKEREQSELFKSCNIESASNFVFVSRKFLLAIENQWPLDLTDSYHDLFQRQTRQKNEGKAVFSHMLFRSSPPKGLAQATGSQAWKNKRALKEFIPRIKKLALS